MEILNTLTNKLRPDGPGLRGKASKHVTLSVLDDDETGSLVEDMLDEAGEALAMLPAAEQVSPWRPTLRGKVVVEEDDGRQVQLRRTLGPIGVLGQGNEGRGTRQLATLSNLHSQK